MARARRAAKGSARRLPAKTSGRDQRVDILRGFALLSMFVAHVAPSGGPGNVLFLAEFATAPLFALLIGIGAELGDRGNRGLPSAFVRAGIRAAVLVALSLWVETWGAQIDIVLIYLALPTLLAPLLARLPVKYLMGLGLVLWGAGPALKQHFTADMAQASGRGDELSARLYQIIFAGANYRLTTLLVFTCMGIVIWRWMSSVRVNWNVGVAGLALLALAAPMALARSAGRLDFDAYDGTHLETGFTVLLVGGLAMLWLGLAPERVRFPLLSVAGSMTLTVYVLQIAYLAWYVRSYVPGGNDDSWNNLAVLTAGGLLLPLLWRSAVPKEPWTKGPIEGPTAAVTRLFR